MAITAAGVGSGLDINGIVTQLMALEQEPVRKLEADNREYDAQLSAYGKLSSAVSSFETAMENLGSVDKFRVFSAVSSDETILAASTTSQAAAGIYNVEVTRLAQNHKMGSGEIIDANNSFTGSLGITIDGTLLTVDLTGGLSLSGIRDKINSDSNNPGVTATIVNTANGQSLILTSEESGADKAITVDETSVIDSGTALGLATINPDPDEPGTALQSDELGKLDAAFTIDDFYNLTASSNSVSNAIDGITFELKEVGSAKLTLSRDTDQIIENVKEFTSSYNELQKLINDYSADELQGDSTLRSIQYQLRNVLNTAPTGLDGSYNFLSQIGILSNGRTGLLEIDENDLTSALDSDFQSVVDLFANDDQGYAFRFAELADGLQDNNRGLALRKETLQNRIDDNEDRIFNLEYQLGLKETALRAKFASLDSLIASLQSSSSSLSQIGIY